MEISSNFVSNNNTRKGGLNGRLFCYSSYKSRNSYSPPQCSRNFMKSEFSTTVPFGTTS